LTVFTIILLAVVGLTASLLIPRFKFRYILDSDHHIIEFSHFWFGITVDWINDTVNGRILFLTFKQKTGEESEAVQKEKRKERKTERKKPTIQKPAKPTKVAGKRFKVRLGKPPREKKEKDKAVKWTYFWQQRQLIGKLVRHLVSTVTKLTKTINIDRLKAHLVVATPDPAASGMLYGCLTPLIALNRPPKRDISLDIDFDGLLPSGELAISISVRPITVLFILLYEAIRLPWFGIYHLVRDLRAA